MWGGGEVYDHLMSTRNIHFDCTQDTHMISKNYEESGYGPHSRFDNHLVLISTCFHVHDKWATRKMQPYKVDGS